MSKLDKAKLRLAARPKDYTIKFYRLTDQRIILLHKPHPGDVMSICAIRDLATRLEEMGEL